MDIFDEEDLLAIANDGASSSSNAESSSDSSSVASGALQTGGRNNAEDDKSCVNEKQKRQTITKDDSPTDEESDSDDADGGFLDSWLADLKSCGDGVKEETLLTEKRAEERNSQDGSLAPNEELGAIETEPEGDIKCDDSASVPTAHTSASLDVLAESKLQEEGRVPIQLGQSVLNWITKYNSKKRKANSEGGLCNDAIVGIHKHHSCDDELQSLLMIDFEMNGSSAEHVKSNTGPVEHSAIITLANDEDNIHMDTASNSQRFRGEVRSCTSSGVRKLNSLVDCVAIYDKNQKCYILEMVDVTVANLQPCLENIAADQDAIKTDVAYTADITNGFSFREQKRPEKIVDPRLLAKRAEVQVKKLRRGKRKSVGKESNPNTKARNGNVKSEDRVE